MDEVNALNNEKDTKVEIAHDIKIDYFGTNGLLKGILTAPVLYRYHGDTPYVHLPNSLKVDFYKDSLQLQSVLTAKEGFYYVNTNKITVKDSVVLTTQDGKMLETDVLHWNPKKKRFYTHHPVKLTTPTEVIHGENGLTAPPDFSWYRFYRASGDIQIDTSFSEK